MKTQRVIRIKKQFVLTAQEISDLNALPDNLPEIRLTEKQKRLVYNLYNKYIYRHIDTQKWGRELYRIEQLEKWPSGPRVKTHEAQRMVLGWLVNDLQYYNNLTLYKAVQKFHSALSLRSAYGKLIENIYDVQH